MTIENHHEERPLITPRGAIGGFVVGVTMVVVVLAMDAMAMVEVDFSKKTNRTLFCLPIVTAVCLPLLSEATNRIGGHLFSRRRRYGAHALAHDPDAAALADPPSPVPMTDDDFLPSDKALHGYNSVAELETSIRSQLASGGIAALYVEDLRLFVMCRLYQGQTQREVEDELVTWGLSADYAIGIVSSTRTVGKSGPIGTAIVEPIGDVAKGHWASPTAEVERQLASRADRRDRLARRLAEQSQGDLPATNTTGELTFDPKATATLYVKQVKNGLWMMWVVLGFLLLAVAYFVYVTATD